jgi:4a-hydroxytetrahydrobiopterin dehydratase
MSVMTILTGPQLAGEHLDGWVYIATVLGGLQTRIRTPDFATGLQIVAAVGAAAAALDHHVDLDLRADHVDVCLSSDEHMITERDVRLAREITAIAASAGAALESATVSRVELALDTPDATAVSPFWRAVLGLGAVDGTEDSDEVIDADEAVPALWFQPSGRDEPRQRWHPDVWIEPAQVQPRIDAALAAGGKLVSDAEAPSFWVLADPDGNRMCLCTWQGRS